MQRRTAILPESVVGDVQCRVLGDADVAPLFTRTDGLTVLCARTGWRVIDGLSWSCSSRTWPIATTGGTAQASTERVRCTGADAVLILGPQNGYGGAEVGFTRVPETFNEWVPFECRLYYSPLHTGPASVNHPHLAEASVDRGMDILLDDRFHIPRRKGMQIEHAIDRELVCHAAPRT
jgi:hypothetical protein